MTVPNPATALATVLVDELARGGVREAVIAPGSRSTPLALALHANQRIRIHVRIDERSAAFLALGLAKCSGRPVPVVCTSGTAAANLHPAVLEADQARVPLLVLTADRPPELRQTGANQTTDQIKLYGSAVRLFVEVGAPELSDGGVIYWRSATSRALAAAHDGPVHLNLAFREPLLPSDAPWPAPLDGRPDGRLWTFVPRPDPRTTVVTLPPRGVVVAGDGTDDPAAVVACARALGWPLLAEPSSNARYGPDALTAGPLLLASDLVTSRLAPDLQGIVTFGRPTLSRALLGLYRPGIEHVVVHQGNQWPDPTRTASQVAAAIEARPREAPDSGWLPAWIEADQRLRAALDELLDAGGLSELRAARDLVRALPPGSLLFSGASLPIRHLDLAMPPRSDLRVLANRGLAGIDGSVSTVVGAALHAQRDGSVRAAGLLGDLALLHDQNGLIMGPEEPRPEVTLIVLNNDGGGIFSTLSQRGHNDGFERLFGTPHHVDLAALAAASGWPYARATTPSEFTALLGETGSRIVEVRTTREETARLYDDVACLARTV